MGQAHYRRFGATIALAVVVFALHPAALGSGKRLFDGLGNATEFRLAGRQTTKTGVGVLDFERTT
jgi:hypothetical protein